MSNTVSLDALDLQVEKILFDLSWHHNGRQESLSLHLRSVCCQRRLQVRAFKRLLCLCGKEYVFNVRWDRLTGEYIFRNQKEFSFEEAEAEGIAWAREALVTLELEDELNSYPAAIAWWAKFVAYVEEKMPVEQRQHLYEQAWEEKAKIKW